jgi:hypothetical protein
MYVNDRARHGDGEKIESDETYDYPDDMNELEELRKTIGIESDLDEYMNSTWINLQEMWEEEEEQEEEQEQE